MNTLLQRQDLLIGPDRAKQLAIESGWQKRRGTVSPFEFLFSHLGQASALELTLSAQAGTLSQPVTRQALDQRYNPAAVAFFRSAFQETLAKSLACKSDSTMTQLLQQHFHAVRLFDSTHCSCSDALAQIFPGCGGGGGEAGIKVLLSYDYGAGQLHPLEVLPANRSDQGLAPQACQEVGRGELGIFDKGFYNAPSLNSIAGRGGYFLLPWHHGVSVWQPGQADQPSKSIDVAGSLRASTEARVEWSAVQLGQTPKSRLTPVRLIAYRLMPEQAGRRRAQLREKYRTKGCQPSQQALELAGWQILLTNAPVGLLPSSAAGFVYRVRWQIELVFKQWKSVLRLDVLSSKNESRVRCEIWARLLIALLSFTCYQLANAATLKLYERECSFSKVAKLIQQQGRSLIKAFFSERHRIDSELRDLWTRLLKLARKERQPSRPTTWENLCSEWLETRPAQAANH